MVGDEKGWDSWYIQVVNVAGYQMATNGDRYLLLYSCTRTCSHILHIHCDQSPCLHLQFWMKKLKEVLCYSDLFSMTEITLFSLEEGGSNWTLSGLKLSICGVNCRERTMGCYGEARMVAGRKHGVKLSRVRCQESTLHTLIKTAQWLKKSKWDMGLVMPKLKRMGLIQGGRGYQAGFAVGVSLLYYLIHLLKPELAAGWLVES